MAKTKASGRGVAASDIPVGTQFSADTVNLLAFCRAAVKHDGKPADLRTAIWKKPVRVTPVVAPPTARRASLPIEAAVQYGLLESVYTAKPTAICSQIAATTTEDEAYRLFAKHILLHCNGLAFVSMLKTMLMDDTVGAVNADSIARYSSRNCGLKIIEHNTAINTLRMFLARAGVFDSAISNGRGFWTPLYDVVEIIVGKSVDDLEDIADLRPHQQAYVRALCTVAQAGIWLDAGKIREHAEALYPHVHFSRASIVKDVLESLKDVDLIDFKSGGTSGGKAAKLCITSKFDEKVLAPFLADAAEGVGKAAEKFLRMTAAEIGVKLASSVKTEKGVALEALAIRVMRTLDLEFNRWRVRPAEAGYAEVDVSLVGAVGCLPTKWQVQCKNTPKTRIGNDDIAREAGIASLDGATHILFMANATYTNNARSFVDKWNKQHSLMIFLLDDGEVRRILADFSLLTSILRQKARAIAALKRS